MEKRGYQRRDLFAKLLMIAGAALGAFLLFRYFQSKKQKGNPSANLPEDSIFRPRQDR